MACDSAVYGTSAVCGYNGTDLCSFPITICQYAGLLKGHCHQCEVQYMAWQRPGDQCPLHLQKPKYLVVFQRNSNCTIWRIFSDWGFVGHKTKCHHHVKCSSCSHPQCHSFPTLSLTLWHNFPNRVQFEKFCGSSNLTLAFANTHEEPLLLPHFCGLGDLPNGSSVSAISSSTRCPFTSALDVFGRRTPSSPWIFPNARHYFWHSVLSHTSKNWH